MLYVISLYNIHNIHIYIYIYIFIYIKLCEKLIYVFLFTIHYNTSLVQHNINDAKILNTKRPKDNLTKGEQKALEELSKRDDIIITNADKGGAIVIMDIDKYISEARRQLNDENNYKKLNTDPTLQRNKLVNDTVERLKKISQFQLKLRMVY